MNGISYRVLFALAAAYGVVLLLGGQGCAEKDQPAQSSDPGADATGRVAFVGSYSFRGAVLEDKDLSGIACISPTRCLIGADESAAVQVVALSRESRTLSVLGAISLLPSGEEIDIEGIAAGGDCYYIVGSHGVAKKSGQRQAKRYTICRIKVDPTSGMPLDNAVPLASLTPILEADPILRPYFARPLQQKGVNIEGLAIRQGHLFVGLRNPNLDGNAFVLEVEAGAVFSGVSRPAYTLHKLMLGEGLGIRELVAAREGFLIIAGNAGSEPSDVYRQAEDYEERRGYELFRWDGGGAVEKIGPIPNPPGKAEAMTILQEGPDYTEVLVLFDGAKRGAPSVYRLH